MNRILIAILFLINIHIGAQHIPIRGNLGVKLIPAKENTYGGVFAIADITPNSTAENLELVLGDILLEISEQALDSNQKISQIIGKFQAGKPVTAKVLRNGKVKVLKGIIQAAPLLKKPEHKLKLLEVPFREGFVRAYLTHPKGEGPFPTIYYIQDYPCQSINMHPQSPTIQLTNALVDLGYAVFRIEKPGVGEFINLKPCIAYSFNDEIENFKNGLSILKDQPIVDVEQVYLFGHSLGGNIAPHIAQDIDVAGVIVYGAIVKPWQDYLVDMAFYSQTYAEKVEKVTDNIHVLKAALNALYVDNIPHAALTEQQKKLLNAWHDYKPDGHVFNRKIEFWKSFNNHNYLNEWAKVNVPVLAMHGESDAHALSTLDAELIAEIVNQANPGNGTFTLVQDTNHLLAKVSTRQKELEYISNGMSIQIAFTKFNPQFPLIIDEWIKSEKNKANALVYNNAHKLLPTNKTRMSSMDVIAEDLNNDGYVDIVLATEFGPNRIFFFNNGEWEEKAVLPQLKEYQPPYLGEDSEEIAVADFDNDGDLDLFFVSEDTQNHELLYNDGHGNFTLAETQIPKKGKANAVLVYDFNNDGWQDILIGIRGQNELYINMEGQKFVEQTSVLWLENKDHTQDLILVDIDNDNDLDIVEGIEQGGNNLYVNENGKYNEESDRLPLPNDIETRKVVANDFDQDGDMDLFYCNVGWNPIKNSQNQLLVNDGKGNFVNNTNWLPSDNSTTLDALFLDINNDGYKDLITTNFVNDTKVKVFLGLPEANNYLFTENAEILPELNFIGGTTIIDFNVGEQEYIYLANFKSEDILLKRKK